MGFERTIPAFEQAKIFHSLDLAATMSGVRVLLNNIFILLVISYKI
jgi:hypothetical protein